MDLMWSRIYDVIIKTILCGEYHVTQSMKKNCLHRSNCFELFGYDILIDSDLKPWLVEVNLSPALACDSPLDLQIKSNLLADLYNIIGVKRFDRKKESLNKIKNRMKGYNKMKTTVTPSKVGGLQGVSIQSSTPGGDLYF